MSRRRRSVVRLAPLVVASGTAWSLVGLGTACGTSKSASSADVPGLEAAPGIDTGLEDGASGTDEEGGPSGFVSVAASDLGGGTLGAVFDGTSVLRPGCRATQVYASCVVYGCPADPDAGPPALAGTLTFTGGALEGGVAVDAGATGVYESDTPGAPFSPGQTIVVTASGGGVPAFGPQSVATPQPLDLTSLTPDGGTVLVPTAQDFGFAWAGGGQESLAVLSASGVAADGSFVLLQCTYDAIGGEGVLPSPVLAAVQGVSQGTLGWGQANATMFDAGPWSITLVAGSYGSTPAAFE